MFKKGKNISVGENYAETVLPQFKLLTHINRRSYSKKKWRWHRALLRVQPLCVELKITAL